MSKDIQETRQANALAHLAGKLDSLRKAIEARINGMAHAMKEGHERQTRITVDGLRQLERKVDAQEKRIAELERQLKERS